MLLDFKNVLLSYEHKCLKKKNFLNLSNKTLHLFCVCCVTCVMLEVLTQKEGSDSARKHTHFFITQ